MLIRARNGIKNDLSVVLYKKQLNFIVIRNVVFSFIIKVIEVIICPLGLFRDKKGLPSHSLTNQSNTDKSYIIETATKLSIPQKVYIILPNQEPDNSKIAKANFRSC